MSTVLKNDVKFVGSYDWYGSRRLIAQNGVETALMRWATVFRNRNRIETDTRYYSQALTVRTYIPASSSSFMACVWSFVLSTETALRRKSREYLHMVFRDIKTHKHWEYLYQALWIKECHVWAAEVGLLRWDRAWRRFGMRHLAQRTSPNFSITVFRDTGMRRLTRESPLHR